MIDASSPIRCEENDGVVTLTLTDLETRNALSDEMIEAIIGCCDRINADLGVRCLIVTGAGRGFSSGGNVKDMRTQRGGFGGKTPVEMRQMVQRTIHRLAPAFYALDVPTIAAVNGHAVGAGCDLALMCDIRIAADDASFAESFLRLGLVPGDSGAWFLPRVIGLSRAYEMIFTGRAVQAEEAAAIGLVSRVVPRESLLEEAQALAANIAEMPPHALRLAKRLVRDSARLTLPESLELASTMQALAQSTADHREALSAFIDRRKPEFTGR